MFNIKLLSLPIIGVAAALAGSPATAATYVSDYEIVTQETVVDSNLEKQLIINCPAGKRALGAGWAAVDETGAFIDGHARASLPSWDGSGWTFNVSVDGYHPSWKVLGRVMCAKVESRS